MPTTKQGERVACGTCLFFVPNKGSSQGICRLNPPQVFPLGARPHAFDPKKVQIDFQQVLPTMQAEEWCGHWMVGNPYNRPEEATKPEAKPEPAHEGKPALILPE